MPEVESRTLRQIVNEEKRRAEAREKFMLEAEGAIFSELQSSNKEVLQSIAKGNEAVVSQLIQQVTTDVSALGEIRGLTGVETGQMIESMVNEIVENANTHRDLMNATQKFFESEAGQKIVEGYQKAGDVVKGHVGDVLGETGQWYKDAIATFKGIGTLLSAPFSMFGRKKEKMDEESLAASKLSAKASELLAKEATKKGSLYVHVVNLGVMEAALLSMRESMYKQTAGRLMWQAKMLHLQTKMETFNKVMGGWASWTMKNERELDVLKNIRDILQIQLKQEFRDKLEMDAGPGTVELFLTNIAGLIGLALGGLLGPILLPFITIFKGITGLTGLKFPRLAKAFKWIGDFFTKIPFFGKMLAKFGKMLVRGLKILGIPFTIFLGVIDFVKGFITTEGDMVDKIAGGAAAAIKGFFELPIKVVGWVVDKLTGLLFGEEKVGDGAAKGMFKFIDSVIEFIVDFIRNPFEMILNGLKKFSNFFITLWNLGITGIQTTLKTVLGDFLGGKAAGLLEDFKMEEFDTTKEVKFDPVGDVTSLKEKEKAARTKELGEALQELNKTNIETKKSIDGIGAGQAAQTQTLAEYYGSQKAAEDKVEEPPDVIESIGIWIRNMGMT
jgi:hypothetical protein